MRKNFLASRGTTVSEKKNVNDEYVRTLNDVIMTCFPHGGWSNTSTVTLRVVGGEEKQTQPTVYLGYHVPGGYKHGDLTLQFLGSLESETVKYGHESRGIRTRE
jgi:hypothetical protein